MEKLVSIRSEMACSHLHTRLLLGMGFRHFSMQPAKMLAQRNHLVEQCGTIRKQNRTNTQK